MVGIGAGSAGGTAMPNGKVVFVRATVERASPDRTNYKPYATDLTFGGNLEIDIPVPADEVIEHQKGGKIVLTIAGYASLLKEYTVTIDRMNAQANQESIKVTSHKF